MSVPQTYPIARRVLAAKIEGGKRKRVLAVIAAYLDEGYAPSVREIALRAKLPHGKRDVMLCVALLRRLEADGLLRVEWADAKSTARPPARNRYEVTLGAERGA